MARIRGRFSGVPVVVFFATVTLYGAAPSDIRVTVRVQTVRGGVCRDAYIAVVPEWRPWSRPFAERIASDGSATFAVPAGTYYLVAGARGSGIAVEGPVTIAPRTAKDVAVTLPALRNVSGTVVDEEGNPIEGARVSDVRAVVPPPLDVASELALRHLGSDWTTTTGADGSWTLKLPQAAVPLVIEARGNATLPRLYRPGDEAALTTVLRQGAALRLTIDRAQPDMVVTLWTDSGNLAGVTTDWQTKVWARWASTTTLEWDSLPAGNYRVEASYPDPRHFTQKPFELTTITLSAGQTSEANVILPPAVSAALHEVALFAPKVPAKDFDEGVETVGVDAVGAPRRTGHFVEDVIGGSVIHIRVDETHKPFFAATADRFVASSPEESEADGGANSVPLRASIHPRADAHLIIRSVEKEIGLPRAGTALLHGCGKLKKTDVPVEIVVPIEIAGQDLARFTAPAGCANAILSFDPLEPVILEKPLRPGEQSLGLHFLRGAGLADVRVVSDGAFVAGATVRVEVAGDEYPERDLILAGEANTGQDGWAHLPRLPVLRTLQVTAETSGGERSDSVELRLEPRRHSVVDPLAVLKPASLTVEARIADDVRATFPSARVGTIFIRPADGRHDRSEDQQQNVRDESNPPRFESLHPGKWLVGCLVSAASTYSPIDIGEVTLKGGEDRRFSASVKPLVFHGRISKSGNGVAARMRLIDVSDPTDGAQRFFDSVPDGSFQVVLPNTGMYRVYAARLAAQGNVIPIGIVDFADPARLIQIEFPTAARVAVQVLSGDKPVPNSEVDAMIRRQDAEGVETFPASRMTGSAGSVTFDDLMPGLWTFVARETGSHRAAEKTVDVGSEGELNVTLHLEPARMIEGTVRDAAGVPLPYSRVDCVYPSSSGLPADVSANADSEGKFGVDIDDDSPVAAICSVTAPTGAVDVFRARSGDRLDAIFAPATATLVVEDWSTRWSLGAFWLASADGRVISLSAVASSLGRRGGPLRITAMPAGRWKVVHVATFSQWLALCRGFAGSLPAVTDVVLDAGAAATIRIYGNPATSSGSQ